MSGRNLKLTRVVIVVLVVCILFLCLVALIIDRSERTRLQLQSQLQPFPGPGKLLFATWDSASSEWQVHQLEAGLQAAQLFSFPAEGDFAWPSWAPRYEHPIIVSPAGDMAFFTPGILVNLRTGEYDYMPSPVFYPAFSPDGERLAFVRSGGLYVVKLNPFTAQSEKLLYMSPCDLYGSLDRPAGTGVEVCVQIAGPVWLNEDTLIFSHGTLQPVASIGVGVASFGPDTMAVMDYSGRLLQEHQYTWPDSGTFPSEQKPVGIVQTQNGPVVQIEVMRPLTRDWSSMWAYVEDVLRGRYVPFYPEEEPPAAWKLREKCIVAPDGASMACLDRYSEVGSDEGRPRPALTIADTSATTSRTVLRWEQDEWANLHLVTWWP